MKNLKAAAFTERFAMGNDVAEMINLAHGDAYALSMPMLVSAKMGNKDRYLLLRDMMDISLHSNEYQSHQAMQAWMLGRMILADKIMSDELTPEQKIPQQKTIDDLKKLLSEISTDDQFSAWAWGYLACVDYEYAKAPMLKAAQSLKDLPALLADQLWAWVMCVQAAAQAHDIPTYKESVRQIKMITGKELSVSEAMKQVLTRNEQTANNDFPGWAMAEARAAAQMMGDDMLYRELEAPIKKVVKETQAIVSEKKESQPKFAHKALAERRLTEVTNQLTVENHREAYEKHEAALQDSKKKLDNNT